MKQILASLLAALTLLTSALPFGNKIDTDTAWQRLSEAYVYAFPLVLADATKTVSTNTDATMTGRAPVNQLNHTKSLADASFRAVVTPNVDTIYSQAWLDLTEEPMIFVMPETDRFCNIQLLDAWTNTITVLEEAGTYAITLPGWQGELPAGVTRVESPTASVWLIGRTVLDGTEDLPNVYAIQEQMKLYPLSAHEKGGVYDAPTGTYVEENDFTPLNKVLAMTPEEFFNKANELMETNPPAEADKEILERIAAVNVGPGKKFSYIGLGSGIADRWKQMLQQVVADLKVQSASYAQNLGQWVFYGDPIGDFGTEYAYRMMVAMTGLGANTVDIAIYPKTTVDASGATLTGEKTYTLHIDAMPPTLEGGFWSITAYNEQNFLIDNPIDRYCINDRSEVKKNVDGSVDITLSVNAPEDTTNWLPVSDGTFHLILRVYLPDMAALDTWQAPVITAN